MASLRRVAAGAAVLCSMSAFAVPVGATPSLPLLDMVTVELVLDQPVGAGAPAPTGIVDQVVAIGGSVIGSESGSVLLAEVPEVAVEVLQLVGAHVREPRHMNVPLRGDPRQVPQFGPIPGDAAAAMGALPWQAAGYDGAGVRIGVIDFFNNAFWNTAEMGPLPTAANGRAMCRIEGEDCLDVFSWSPDGNDDPGRHGPAVVEVIRDVAPAADIFIASAETYSDYVQVIDWFAANGVTILSRSLGTYIDGPGDGRGPTDELADYATSKGMVWVNAAGNEAVGGYWRGTAQLTPSGYVQFTTAPVTFPDRMYIDGCSVAALRWNDWDTPAGQRGDYDLELYEVQKSNPQAMGVMSSKSAVGSQAFGADPLEQIEPDCPGPGRQLYLKIRYVGGGTPADDILEILDYDGGLQYHQADYSASLPASDSKNPSVLSVGAIEPGEGSTIASYSSRGPTNDGRIKPDLVAASGVRSSVFVTFHGTSASAPAVAGAAALLLQAGLAAPGPELASLLRSSVRPLGSPVPNATFGAGAIRLPVTYEPLPEPRRVLDTRTTSAIGPSNLIGKRAPGTVLDVPIESLLGRAPGSVAAVALNVTTVDAPAAGWIQVIPSNRASLGAYSNLNIDAPGQTRSNVVLVPVGEAGSISIYVGSGGDTLIDVLGAYAAKAPSLRAGRFVAVDPSRVLDTRPTSRTGSAGGGPDGALRNGESVCIDATAAGIPADSTVSALVLNVTATEVTQPGYVQVLPTGGAPGTTSTLNLVAGGTVANTTIVPLGAPCGAAPRSVSVLLGSGSQDATAQLVVDVTGYITGDGAAATTSGLFVPIVPGRILDTRSTGAVPTGQPRPIQVAGAGSNPQVPSGASGVAANLAATNTRGWGYLTAWPAGGQVPSTSSLNWSAPDATVANGAIVKLSASGALDIESTTPGFALSADHLIDVFGYYT